MEIKKLKLYSARLEEQLHFYVVRLGFRLIMHNENQFQIKAGATQLVFERSNKNSYYHFAFLIPHFNIQRAVDFLKQKEIDILEHMDQPTIDFGTGQSVYFLDQDRNIVEFIERPSLGWRGKSTFEISDVLKVNEIGLPVEDTLSMSKTIIKKYGVQLIDPDIVSEKFCWIGDFNGAFIVTKISRNWLPTDIPGITNDLCIQFASSPSREYKLCFSENRLHDWIDSN